MEGELAVRFTELSVSGAHAIDLEPREDARGFFARAFCAGEFAARGLRSELVQANVARTSRRGTVRGLHYQVAPALEAKLVRCVAGSTYHVLVDLREESPTYRRTAGIELSAASGRAVYVPELCAHGHQTLTDDAEILYLVSGYYSPEHERGVRYDDPALGIEWPLPVVEVSEKDRLWLLLDASGRKSVR